MLRACEIHELFTFAPFSCSLQQNLACLALGQSRNFARICQMYCLGDTGMLHFKLFGPFGLQDDHGRDIRPKLSKSKAILAVLAATPGHRHTRSWFQTLLWEDRQHEQALSSLRSALADIRRALGDQSGLLHANNSEIWLDAAHVRTDLDQADTAVGGFLEGVDIAHSEGFEDWLRTMRARYDIAPSVSVIARPKCGPSDTGLVRLFLGASEPERMTLTQMKCDALVDGLAKSFEEFGLGQVIDGRHLARSGANDLEAARGSGCGLHLVGDSAEADGGAILRIKVIDVETSTLVWSKSKVEQTGFDVEDDPNTIALVAEFIDVIAHRLSRRISWTSDDLSPDMMALAGVQHAFKLGAQNLELSDRLLKQAHALDPKGIHLAWRGFLRTFVLCEAKFGDPKSVIEEGVSFARRALEFDPHNSMVLALCAQVENVMNLSLERGLELSTRALEINRFNPMAWSSLGLSSAYLGRAEAGSKFTQMAARLASGSWYSAQAECWASAACAMAGDVTGARAHAERSHAKSREYAPPMRYLSALYCIDGQFDRAMAMAEKLRAREPGFSFESLKQDGYPVRSLRQGGLLEAVPQSEC